MHSFSAFATTALLAGLAFAQDCVLTVPPNPISAEGLSTPYFVSGCDQTALATASFVECAIYDGLSNITIYHPLVVNNGSLPGVNFVPPLPVTIPSGATVGCWFGTNGMTLTLVGSGAAQCVNGLDGVIFGQYAYCNGDVFMTTAIAAVNSGTLTVPPAGTGLGGQCPTVRDFKMVDQDQSDNVVTTYLLLGNNTLAQNTPANNAAFQNATELANGSDNALVDDFLDVALGCKPFMVNSPTAPTGMSSAMSLNELLSNFNPPVDATPAHVPLNDPMVLQNGNFSLPKVNLYRAGVGQPPAQTEADADPLTYCKNFVIAGIWIQENEGNFAGKTSPMPGVAVDLFTFMAQRFSASLQQGMLGCIGLLNLTNPVNLTLNGDCVVTAATINIAPLVAIAIGNGLNVSLVDDFSATGTATTSAVLVTNSTSATSVSAVTTISLSSSPSGVSIPTVVASSTGSSLALSVTGTTLTVPASASTPTSSTSATTAPTTLFTVATNTATCSFTVTAAPSTVTSTVTVTTSASFTRDPRGLLWDGFQWHVPAIFIGIEWIEFAGPAPTGF